MGRNYNSFRSSGEKYLQHKCKCGWTFRANNHKFCIKVVGLHRKKCKHYINTKEIIQEKWIERRICQHVKKKEVVKMLRKLYLMNLSKI